MENNLIDKYKILNRDQIKYIAMFLMLLNHISIIFLEPGTFLSELFWTWVTLLLLPCAIF